MFLTSHSSQIINLMFMNSVGSTSQMAEALHFQWDWALSKYRVLMEGMSRKNSLSPCWYSLSYTTLAEEYPNGATGRTSQWIVGMETGCLQTLWKVLLVEHDQYSVVYNASNPVAFIDDYAINSWRSFVLRDLYSWRTASYSEKKQKTKKQTNTKPDFSQLLTTTWTTWRDNHWCVTVDARMSCSLPSLI